MTTERRHLVVVGVGQLNALFAAGALKAGMTVAPLLRSMESWSLDGVPSDAPLLMGMGEGAVAAAWARLPVERRPHAVLMQNELFPSSWEAWGAREPTVMVVWLNRKQDAAPRPGPPTQLFGRHAPELVEVHRALGLACEVLPSMDALRGALAAKYAFILALNALGHHTDRTLGAWCGADRAVVDGLLEDGLRLGARLAGLDGVPDSIRALASSAVDLHHGLAARGRTAGERVARAFAWGREHGVELPALRALFPDVVSPRA